MLKCCPVWRSAARDWTPTLRLPRSCFPTRPDLSLRQQLLQRCSDDLYAWQAVTRPANNTFTLHDGPPYANGDLHLGHALNKILKDIFNRFQLSQNKRVNYLPGWDCHGLPIELKALQQSGVQQDAVNMEPTAIRHAAAKLAANTIEKQMEGFKSWAVMGDWSNAYKTMNRTFEVKQLQVFRNLVQKGTTHTTSQTPRH